MKHLKTVLLKCESEKGNNTENEHLKKDNVKQGRSEKRTILRRDKSEIEHI